MTAAPDRLLRRLEWQVLRRLDGALHGAHRSVHRGYGIDLAGMRPYEPGDDIRHIDWNVTARLDEPHVRIFSEDREVTAWLVLDRSASMRFGSGGHGKDVIAGELTVALARLLSRTGNRVGAVLYDGEVHEVVPPGLGRRHVLRLAAALTAPARAQGTGRTTDLAAMLAAVAAVARRRGLVVVVSDFVGDAGWGPALARLNQRHEVVAIRVTDPVETALPGVGLVVVEDAETGEQLYLDASDPAFSTRLREEATAHDEAVAEAMRLARVRYHGISTHDDLVEVLIGLVRDAARRT
ncbi:MAG: DUF58 domain-containing protein [Propionicimonas sp.]|nr:DUF58 domain-containing protein [Propionicimonas sp.]